MFREEVFLVARKHDLQSVLSLRGKRPVPYVGSASGTGDYPQILRAAKLAAIPAGERPAGGTCPVAAVVISGGGKGDQPAGSPDVNVSVGRRKPVGSAKGGKQLDRS